MSVKTVEMQTDTDKEEVSKRFPNSGVSNSNWYVKGHQWKNSKLIQRNGKIYYYSL